jgi:hypothetical protein
VDGNDFLAWQRNLGWSALNVGSPITPVPEPAGATIVGMAATLAMLFRQRCANKRDA